MAKTFRLKLPCARGLLTLLLIFGVVSTGYTNGEEPPGATGQAERLSGPATIGTLTLTPTSDGLLLSFNGRCGPQTLVFGPVDQISKFNTTNFATLTAQDLINRRVRNGVLLAPCYVLAGVLSGDLIVNSVTNFSNTGAVATADVVVLAVVPL